MIHEIHRIMFIKNLAMSGGALLIQQFGPGLLTQEPQELIAWYLRGGVRIRPNHASEAHFRIERSRYRVLGNSMPQCCVSNKRQERGVSWSRSGNFRARSDVSTCLKIALTTAIEKENAGDPVVRASHAS